MWVTFHDSRKARCTCHGALRFELQKRKVGMRGGANPTPAVERCVSLLDRDYFIVPLNLGSNACSCGPLAR